MIVHPGDQLSWNDSTYQVCEVNEGYVVLRDTVTDVEREVASSVLEKTAVVPEIRRLSSLSDLRILKTLGKADRREVDVWLEELRAMDVRCEGGQSKERAYEQTASQVAGRLGAEVSTKKVYRRKRDLETYGVVGLLDRRRFGLTNRKGAASDPRLLQAIMDVFDGETNDTTGTKGRAHWRVARRLDELYGPGVVAVPSTATLYRLLEKLERGRHTFGDANTRRGLANQPDRVFFARPGVRPGEQVLIDTSPMEIEVDCGGELPLRPDITVMLDACSRSIVAAVVTVATRSIDLIVVLARAMVPYAHRPEGIHLNRVAVAKAWTDGDPELERQFEELRNRQPYIFPESITTDHGKAYVSQHFSDACRSLGISLTLAAVYTPTDKAKIERNFKSIRTMFTQYALGYVGEKASVRGKKRYSSDQLLTLEQLQEILEDWIAATWQNRPHKGLRDPRHPSIKLTPNQMVQAYREVAPELHIPFTAETYISLLPTEWRRINSDGVSIRHRQYNSERLRLLRRTQSPHTKEDGKWPIRVDPYNPMIVWLEVQGEFSPLTWTSAHSGMPMHDEVWRIARAQAAARGQDEASHADLAEVMRRFMSDGNAPLTERQRKRVKATHQDPMGVTRQLESKAAAAPRADDDPPPRQPKEWPDAGTLGFTRHPGREDS